MKYIVRISVTMVALVMLLAQVACTPDGSVAKFSLSCGTTLTLAEGETIQVEVVTAGEYSATVDNHNVSIAKSGAIITITGVKVGDSELTVTATDGETLTCKITVEKSSQQKNFVVISTPRVENWLGTPLNTDTTAGLQVTCERGIDAAGLSNEGVTTFGFYFVESGEYLRLSAQGDFATKGELSDGMLVMAAPNATPQYYLCEKVEVVKVAGGKSWIVVSLSERSDVRIVTEVF